MQVTPAGFTFAIWGVIFFWQISWLLYAWTYQCRPEAVHTISTGTYVGFALGSAINSAWLYLFGNELINWSFGFLVGFDVVTYITIGLFAYTYFSNYSTASKIDDFLSKILVLNGLALYATWTTIAGLINFSIVVQYTYEWDPSTVGTVTLSLLGAAVVLYFTQENTLMYPYTKSVFTVYPVVIWALIGVLAKHWGVPGEERTAIFALVLLLGTVALIFLRGALFVIFFHFRKPRSNPSEKIVPLEKAELI